MRNLFILILLLIILTSCGAINESCPEDIRMGCNTIFGFDSEYHQDKAKDMDDKLREDLDKRLLTITESMTELEVSITDLGINVDQLEVNVVNMLMRIGELEDNVLIEGIESPCQDSKEVLIYLRDGRVVAYFESGNKRYLSFLSPGRYRTTDNTNCTFTIE